MDDLEFSSVSESSGLSTWGEKTKEQGEKQRDAYKKAQAQLQKSQKDEKKAKWDNEDLFAILLRFIQNPYYETLIPLITDLLQASTPSRFIIGLTALVYPESALHILTKAQKKDTINLLLSLHRYETPENFNEHSLHPSIRAWMSAWVQFSADYLVGESASQVLHHKLRNMMHGEQKEKLHASLSGFIYFFFTSRNLQIHKNTTDSYADFIMSEYLKLLEKTLQTTDPDLLDTTTMDASKLFGID
jgi:hypothetical protein